MLGTGSLLTHLREEGNGLEDWKMWQQLSSLKCTVEFHSNNAFVPVKENFWGFLNENRPKRSCTLTLFGLIQLGGREEGGYNLLTPISWGRLSLKYFILSRLGVIKIQFSSTLGRVGRQLTCLQYHCFWGLDFISVKWGFISYSMFLIKKPKNLFRLCRSGC